MRYCQGFPCSEARGFFQTANHIIWQVAKIPVSTRALRGIVAAMSLQPAMPCFRAGHSEKHIAMTLELTKMGSCAWRLFKKCPSRSLNCWSSSEFTLLPLDDSRTAVSCWSSSKWPNKNPTLLDILELMAPYLHNHPHGDFPNVIAVQAPRVPIAIRVRMYMSCILGTVM